MRDRGDYTTGDWTFRINGKEFFVKGCSRMPADSFHDEDEESFRAVPGNTVYARKKWRGSIP